MNQDASPPQRRLVAIQSEWSHDNKKRKATHKLNVHFQVHMQRDLPFEFPNMEDYNAMHSCLEYSITYIPI